MKEPKCKICGGKHYKFQCWQNPRKPIESKKPLKPLKIAVESKIKSNTTKLSSSKKNERKSLINKLDRLCSEIIRKKGCNSAGENWCYTCGVKKSWKQLDCGHFYSRRFINTRWHLDNMKPQCVFCNRNLGGNLQIYEKKLKRELGEDKFNELLLKSRDTTKISTVELAEKLENLKKNYKIP